MSASQGMVRLKAADGDITPYVKLEQLEDATKEEIAEFRKSQSQNKKAAGAAAEEAQAAADKQAALAEAQRRARREAADAAAAAAARASAAEIEELQRVADQKRMEAEQADAEIRVEDEGKARAHSETEQWEEQDDFNVQAVEVKAKQCRQLELLARQQKYQQRAKAADAEAQRIAAMNMTPPDLAAAGAAKRRVQEANRAVLEAVGFEAKARAEAEEHERWLAERHRREEEKKQRKPSEMVSGRNIAKGLGERSSHASVCHQPPPGLSCLS